MSSRRCHRRSGTTIALTGTGKTLLYSAAVPLLVIWYTVKVAAILALAVHDTIRGYLAARRAARRLELDAPAAGLPQSHYSNRR